MLDFSSITLFCADCVDVARAITAIERCKSVAKFGAVKFLTSLPTDYEHINIQHLPSLVDYSIFMLKRAVNYIDTPYMLVIQHDGYIINPESWNPQWLDYDYIGPLYIQDYADERSRVGSGGFSLRSKSLMQWVDGHMPAWTGNPKDSPAYQKRLGAYEDGVICHTRRNEIERAGFKIAPVSEALKFAQGGWPQECSSTPKSLRYFFDRPFGFHGKWTNIDLKTGLVQSPPFMPVR